MLAAALLCAVGVWAGCGDSSSGEDVDKVLDQTFSRDNKVDSGKMEVDLTAKLKGVSQLSQPVTVRIGGPFDGLEEKVKDTGRLPKSDFQMTADAGGQKIQAGAVSTGDKLFINFQGTNYAVPDNLFERFKRQLAKAQKEADQSKQPDLGSLGIDPRTWLTNAKDEGTEDVSGVETIHISAGVNVNRLLDDFDRLLKRTDDLGLSQQQRQQLPDQIPSSVRKQIADSVKDARIEVFTGKDDKVLRKLKLKLDFDVPASLRSQAQGLQSGQIELTYEMADLNKPQTIEEPKSSRPLSELQRQFGGTGLGALGGSGSGAGSSGGSSGGSQSSSPQARRYLKCVEGAQGTSELQKCADLLR
jgi:hypothetical protein